MWHHVTTTSAVVQAAEIPAGSFGDHKKGIPKNAGRNW